MFYKKPVDSIQHNYQLANQPKKIELKTSATTLYF